MIITFAQTKGGVGKTTLAVNLAVERVIRGHRDVLLVDADEQGTASDFAAIRAERLGRTGFTAVQLTSGGTVRGQVLAMRDKFNDIVIDVGGRDTAALRAALTLADLAVVPFQPRSFDVWTLDKVAALITEAKIVNLKLRAYAVINCADPQGQDNRAAADSLAEMPRSPISTRRLDAEIVSQLQCSRIVGPRSRPTGSQGLRRVGATGRPPRLSQYSPLTRNRSYPHDHYQEAFSPDTSRQNKNAVAEALIRAADHSGDVIQEAAAAPTPADAPRKFQKSRKLRKVKKAPAAPAAKEPATPPADKEKKPKEKIKEKGKRKRRRRRKPSSSASRMPSLPRSIPALTLSACPAPPGS